MPFDYLYSKVPLCYRHAPEKAEAQYLKELEERASLLYRLRYDKAEARRRLLGNLSWDWECNPRPAFVERARAAVDDIVERVFARPRPPDKGRRVTAQDLKVKPTD